MADNNVSTRRAEVASSIARGKLVQDLLGGTPAMQAAKETYLVKRVGEPQGKYDARLKAAVLLNALKRTVGYLAGQVFSKDVTLQAAGDGDNATLPPLFHSMLDDVDLQGNNLTVWANDFFVDSINRGIGLLLVDYPMVKTRTEGGSLQYEAEPGLWRPKTAAADQENGWRPYFVHISLADLLGWRFERKNGRRVLTQLRFLERVTDTHGTYDTDDVVVEQVRVLFPGGWETWREEKDAKGAGTGLWSMNDNGATTLQEIPVAWFSPGEPVGEMCAYPALEDLAHLNRRHWQSFAEHTELMNWVRAPGMWCSGVQDMDAEMPWGLGQLTKLSSPDAKMGVLGVDAASVEASAADLKALEERMALYGLQLLMPETGDTTATAKALDAAESDSTLQRWAKLLKDCLEQGFKFAAMWSGVPVEQAPRVVVNTDFHMLAGLTATEIGIAVEKGFLPKRAAFDELKRRGVQYEGDWQTAQGEIEDDQRGGGSVAPAASLADSLLGQQGRQGA